MNKHFLKYLTLAPVLAFISISLVSAFIIVGDVLGAGDVLVYNIDPRGFPVNSTYLVPCGESEEYQKVFNKKVEALESRRLSYSSDSDAYNSIESQIARVELSRNMYSSSQNSVCGRDGLPRVVLSSNELLLASCAFLYIVGGVGWGTREYLGYVRSLPAAERGRKEIALDVGEVSKVLKRVPFWPYHLLDELLWDE
jgi:hypothetical protein